MKNKKLDSQIVDEKVNTRRIYTGIDLFKLIAAVLVVLLHAIETTEGYLYELKYVATLFVVPFFFIASGFFFYQGLSNTNDRRSFFIKYEKKLLKLFVIWALVLYLPFVITSYIHNNPGASVLKIVLLLVRRVFIIGPGPYWYLVALAWSVAFLYFCYEKRESLLKIAIVLGLLIEICYTCFYGVLSQLFVFRILFRLIYFVYSWEFNFLMFGIPFAGIGFLLGKRELTWNKTNSVLIFAIATLLRIVEYNLPQIVPGGFWETNCISVAFIVQAIAFFMIARSTEFSWSCARTTKIRQLSSFIYFSHVIILYNILNPVLSNYTTLPVYSGGMVLPKTLIVLLVCVLLFSVIKRIDNSRLNILING